MQPVEKSGQSEQTGFLNQDGNSCERVSHGNRIRERKAALQYLGVQLNNCVCLGGGGAALRLILKPSFPSPGNENRGAVR